MINMSIMLLTFQMCSLLSVFPVRYFEESSVKSLGHLNSRKIWSTGETSENENLTKHIREARTNSVSGFCQKSEEMGTFFSSFYVASIVLITESKKASKQKRTIDLCSLCE